VQVTSVETFKRHSPAVLIRKNGMYDRQQEKHETSTVQKQNVSVKKCRFCVKVVYSLKHKYWRKIWLTT